MSRTTALPAAAVLLLAAACHSSGAGSPSSESRPLDASASAPTSTVTSPRPEVSVTRVVSDASSVILRAAHIVVLTVVKTDEGPWEPGPLRSQVQEIHLDVTVAEVLKGTVVAKAGAPLRVSGHRSRPGPRDAGVPRVWSSVDVAAGARLVVFSSASSSDAAAVLAEPALIRVLPASPAEDEVRRALAIERAGGPLAGRIQTVAEPPALSPLFGEYVVARLAEDTLYRDAAGFDRVMGWLEHPGRSTSLQMFVIQSLVGKVLMTEPNPPGFTERLALAALRVLGSTKDEALGAQIVDTYLPNLLGLEGAGPAKSVQTVFHGDDRARVLAREALLRRPAGAARDRLLGWIGR